MSPDCDEENFEDALLDMAVRYGWRVHAERPAHTADRVTTSIKGHRGFPDFTAVHAVRGIILAELKSAKGKFGPGQPEWITAFAHHDYDGSPVLVEVWRPKDWDAIEVAMRDGFEEYRAKFRRH